MIGCCLAYKQWLIRVIKRYTSEFLSIVRHAHEQENKSEAFDWQTAVVCTIAALSLLFIQFIAKSGNFLYLLKDIGLVQAFNHFSQAFKFSAIQGNLVSLIWFASWCFFFYMVLPTFIMRVVFQKSFADFGLKFKGAFLYGRFYIIFMAVMFPLILFAATFPSFQNTYPFYHAPQGSSLWPNILIWECFYFLQFVGTEFFFRGFLIHGLKHRFGFYAVFLSMIPYCMIHFQKPFLEAFGSIIAGFVLGVMSLRTNSVMMGIALHYGVAITMDICSLLMTSRL